MLKTKGKTMLKTYSYKGVQVTAHTKNQACRKAVAAAHVAEFRARHAGARRPSKKFMATAAVNVSSFAKELVSEFTGGSEVLIKSLAPKVEKIIDEHFYCYGGELKCEVYRDRSDEISVSLVNSLDNEEKYYDKMDEWYLDARTEPYWKSAEEIFDLLSEHWETELSGTTDMDDVRFYLEDNIPCELPDFLHDNYYADITLEKPENWFEKLVGMSYQEIAEKALDAAEEHPDDMEDARKAAGFEGDLYEAILDTMGDHYVTSDLDFLNKNLSEREMSDVLYFVKELARDITINAETDLETILDAKASASHKFGRNIKVGRATDISVCGGTYVLRSAADVVIPDSEFYDAKATGQGGNSDTCLA